MEKISQKISDVLGDVPVRFEVDGKEYCIYPPTLGRELILGSLKTVEYRSGTRKKRTVRGGYKIM